MKQQNFGTLDIIEMEISVSNKVKVDGVLMRGAGRSRNLVTKVEVIALRGAHVGQGTWSLKLKL